MVHPAEVAPPAEPPDEQGRALLERWRSGDAAAFSELFAAYRGLVYGVLHHLLHKDPELEDVVQSAFIEIFRSLDSFEGRSKLSSWIARVALHVGYHHLRRKRSRRADYDVEREVPELPDETPRANPEVALDQRDAIRRVHAILAELAPKKRTVFILNDLQGLPQEEVAEIVGASVATVRTRLFYARQEFWAKAEQDPVLCRVAPGAGVRPPRTTRDGGPAGVEETPQPGPSARSKLTPRAGRRNVAAGGVEE